jgi:hypothetical protein
MSRADIEEIKQSLANLNQNFKRLNERLERFDTCSSQ